MKDLTILAMLADFKKQLETLEVKQGPKGEAGAVSTFGTQGGTYFNAKRYS